MKKSNLICMYFIPYICNHPATKQLSKWVISYDTVR